MAKNDWIVAGLNNPDFTPQDFSNIADMDLNNTQMLSANEYLKSDFIKNHEMFKDDSGNFSEEKFNQYHKKRLQDFKEFQEHEFPKGPQLDMFDTDRTKESKVKDIRFDLGRHVNPDRQAVGIEGVRVWSDPTQTKSEIAQSQKIWDTKNQEFKDYSSNDKALSNGMFDWLKQVFSDPLVMAQWEENGEHIDPITGITKTHKAGDYKLNEKGTYYYETLNNRSPIGKEVLSVFDTLTVDGEGINKYDFFDSDDVEKSIAGVIAKNVAVLLPMFTPVGAWYSGAIAVKEMAKAMPMLYGIVTMLSDNDTQPEWINNAAAWGAKLSGGTSQYAKENTFSFENFGNLIADVALQWGQQKAIATTFNKLKGSKSYIDEALTNAQNLYKTKAAELGESAELWKVCQDTFLPQAQKLATQAGNLGRDMSLAYMAIVSNSDLYSEMRSMGLTNTEAAAISFGSTLGMLGLNKWTNIGEVFFDDATDDAVKLARQAVKAEMKDALQMFKSIKSSNLPEPNKYLKMIKVASDKVVDVFNQFGDDLKYHTLNFAGKAIGEGLEEVSEEAISDTAKEIYELAGYFGVDTTLKDIGAWDNALERYSMSLIGGALGGGIFYGKEALIDGKTYKRDPKNWEIATLIRNGHANELRAEIEKLKKSGKLASTTLSASKYEEDSNGDKVWLTTRDKNESQNDAIGNAMLEKVNALEAVINNNRVGLSDEQLFENMVLTEKRYKRYEKVAGLTNYYQDFANIVNNLIAAELDYKKAAQTVEGTVNGTPLTDAKLTPQQETERAEQLLKLQERVDQFRQQKDEFLSGDTSLDYTRKLNFVLDPRLHSQYLSIDQNQFFKEKYGDRAPEELSFEELYKFNTEWQKKVEETLKLNVDKAWNKFKEVEALIMPELHTLAETTSDYKQFIQKSEDLIADNFHIRQFQESLKGEDDILEGETEEEFNVRNTKLTIDGVEETDEEFQFRKNIRIQKINEYNKQKAQEWVDMMNEHLAKVDFKLDPFTYRELKRSLPVRQLDILKSTIANTNLPSQFKHILSQLKPDLSNVDEVKEIVKNVTKQETKTLINKALDRISKLELVVDDEVTTLEDYMIESQDADLSFNDVLNDPDILDVKNEEFIETILQLAPVLGDTTLGEFFQQGTMLLDTNEAFNNYVEEQNSVKENEIDTLLAVVTDNPIYKFSQSIRQEVKNPIGQLVKSLAEKNGDAIPNIDYLFDVLWDNYENVEDVHQLLLDDSQIEDLQKASSYLKLIDGFMYAASSNPDKHNPYGHNQVINSFAEKHSDLLRKEWQTLPEIDSDYFTLYDQSIAQYTSEADWWIKLSNDNNVNKIRKFVATDSAFNKALFDSIKSRSLKISFNDKEFNLLEGLVEGSDIPEINLFNAEKLLYKNFQLALKESGLSAEDFIRQTGLLEKLIPSLSNITKQTVANLTDTLKAKDLTDFDLLQYFAQVFTLNPSQFQQELKSKVKLNEKVAPITAQEYSTKLARAIASPVYRAFMKIAYEKSGSQLPFLSNTLVIPGVAGAGKTSVVLSSVNNPNEECIIAGPTETQATTLQKSLNRSSSQNFTQLLESILGTEQLTAIKTEFAKVKNGNKINDYDCEYFSVKNVNGVAVISLKRDSLKFNTFKTPPKKIFLDEATHLGALDLQIIDAFADSIDAVVYAAGDPNQRGAFSASAKTENLQEDQIFCSRAPKLSISLRDNNLQKYVNQERVRTLLDDVNDHVLNQSTDELKQYWPQAISAIHKFNFQVYNHDELNGDLITKELDDTLLSKLKGDTKTVGFVGDASSPYLHKLKEAGINPKVMSMDQMQGSEFDFVIIDQQWTEPQANYSVKMFLTDLYTTMTRATTASIFINNGLSDIIGKNTISNNKSKAPSILAGVKELREKKLAILDKLELDLSEETETPEPPKPIVKNAYEDLIDPDTKNLNQAAQEVIYAASAQEETNVKEAMSHSFSEDGEHVLETFTDTTILGAIKGGTEKRVITKNGKQTEKEFPTWVVDIPSDGPLRNLQALYKDKVTLVSYTEKMDAQRKLFDIKSAIMFQHDYGDLPSTIKKVINKADWESGTLEIEIRKPGESDTTHLNAKYDEPGMEYNGQRYIVNLVYKVKLKSGREAIFDISGLPNINDYSEHIAEIKANLERRITDATDPEEKQALEKRLKGVQPTFDNYSTLLKQWIEAYEKGTFKPIKVNPEAISFNQTTWFQKLEQSKRADGLQLGGYYDPITGQSRFNPETKESETHTERSRNTLKMRHPEMVFSKIYTYAADSEVFDKLDPSIKGSAVVFVSSDTLINEKDLLRTWLQQKKEPKETKARVRMLVLDNYGMTFSQFIDPQFISTFQKGDGERKPFRQNFTGIRMFTALWNWRASLKQFNTALEAWRTENNFTPEQVDVLAEAQQLVYDKQDPTELLTKNGLKKEDIDKLTSFNQVNCENIPIFRLGHSKNGHGFYVRQEDVKSSTKYTTDTANLLAITRSKAEQFAVLVDRIMSAIEYSDTLGAETLGVRLLKQDKTPWKPDELIDLNKDEHKRTLSGLLQSQFKKLVLVADKREIAYADGDQWSMIPAMVSNIVRTITYFQHNPDQLNNAGTECASIKIKDEETKVLLKTQIGDLFTDKHLNVGDDGSLFDMLNLAFHGTTDDIHKKLPKGEQLMQLDDAYFKRGFFISPDVVRVLDKNTGTYKLVSVEDSKKRALFYEIETSEELFTVDTDVRTAGIGLRIDKLFDQIKKEEEQEEIKKEEERSGVTQEELFKQQHPDLVKLIDDMAGEEDVEYTLDSAKDALKKRNEAIKLFINNRFENKQQDIIEQPFYQVLDVDNKLQTVSVKDYIAFRIGSDSFTIEFGEGLIITAGSNRYQIDLNTGEITPLTITPKSEEEMQLKEEAGVQEDPIKEILEPVSKWETRLSNGKPLYKAFMDLLNDEFIIEELKSDPFLGGDIDKDITNLQKRLEVIFNDHLKNKNSETDKNIKEDLTNLDSQLESIYSSLLSILGDNEQYNEINKMVEEC